jgi:hypothetical protein
MFPICKPEADDSDMAIPAETLLDTRIGSIRSGACRRRAMRAQRHTWSRQSARFAAALKQERTMLLAIDVDDDPASDSTGQQLWSHSMARSRPTTSSVINSTRQAQTLPFDASKLHPCRAQVNGVSVVIIRCLEGVDLKSVPMTEFNGRAL